MNSETILMYLGMTKESLLNETSNLSLEEKELNVLKKGKDFFDDLDKIQNQESLRRIILILILYKMNKKAGKQYE